MRKGPVPIPDAPTHRKRRAFGQVGPDELSVDTVIEFRKANPRIRYAAVWRAYRAFLARERVTPRDIDAHFKDYAAKWVKGAL